MLSKMSALLLWNTIFTRSTLLVCIFGIAQSQSPDIQQLKKEIEDYKGKIGNLAHNAECLTEAQTQLAIALTGCGSLGRAGSRANYIQKDLENCLQKLK